MIKKGAHFIWVARNFGRADRFMRFLRICRLGFIDARRIWQVTLAKILVDILADRGNRFAA